MFFSRSIRILLCFFLLAVSAGCFPKKTLPLDIPRLAESVQSLIRQAEVAWQARNYAESGRLYECLAWEPQETLDPRFLPVIRDRLAQSLLQTRNFDQAGHALNRWAEHDSSVQAQWTWHDYWVRALLGQGRQTEAERHLRQLLRQPGADWKLRYPAGIRLAEMYRQARTYAPMAEVLAELFALEPDEKSRVEMERMAMQIAKGLSDGDLLPLVQSVSGEEQWTFPYSVFFWEQQRRAASLDPGAWPNVRTTLKHLLQRGKWADSATLSLELEQMEKSLGLPGMCLGLVLPLDGPLAETGWKILRGVEAGRNTLFLGGLEIRLEVLNALSSELVENIRGLDAECAVIGGPLQRETWQSIQDAGLIKERTFFAFLPSLGETQEGRQAWRFFSTPQDQVRALAALSVQTLGILSNAVLYPEDSFGRHMMELFSQEVAAQGGIVRKVQGYSPSDHGAWGGTVASLLGVQAQQRRGRAKTVQLPNPGFQALFIPDNLAQAEMLIPQLFYYDEQRLLILGPELWSHAWNRREGQREGQYFRLAVMPSAWWPENPSPAARTLIRFAEESATTADFWVALGYDFVRWAAALGQIPADAGERTLNAMLARPRDFQWSMAPLHWDSDGIARQDVYLFQPTSTGLSILDSEALRVRLERNRTLHGR